jgi:excisionase family DNA binding protein
MEIKPSSTPVIINPEPAAANQIEKLAFSTREAAQAIGVSEMTIYRLIQRKKLCAVPHLRHKIISRKEIDRFLNSGRN